MVTLSNALFSFSAITTSLVLLLKFSFLTIPQEFEIISEIWSNIDKFPLYILLSTCIAPYITYQLYSFFWIPVAYNKTLEETEEAPKNFKKRLANSGQVPPPYPNGWFFIARSAELKVGEVKPISVLGNEYALFRGEDGIARLIDAFCPHLGANLAHGGTVTKNCITCPFHGWEFNGDNGKVCFFFVLILPS